MKKGWRRYYEGELSRLIKAVKDLTGDQELEKAVIKKLEGVAKITSKNIAARVNKK